MKHVTFILLIVTACFFVSPEAPAAIVGFTGIIDDKGSNTSGALDAIDVADVITGWFSYDAGSAVDSNPGEVVGQYSFNSSNSALGVTVYDASNNHSVILDETGFLNSILITNNWPDPEYPRIDGYNPSGEFGWNSETINIYLYFQNRDSGLDIIDSDVLLDSPPPFEQLNFTRGMLQNDEYSWYNVSFDITSAQVVPLPSSLTFLTSSLLALFLPGIWRRIFLR
ncbi:MAG: hypothetical protein JSW26_26975 [Desulfobacterales bacterium]|nr:MAG: hypothetical protein JSW26_26975 [Desulfobacterales bacterium]